MNEYNLNHKRYTTQELILFATEQINRSHISEWERDLYCFILNWLSNPLYISIQTSGSTGVPKEIQISKAHMIQSAERTLRYFGVKPSENVLLCLPSKYIAGMMMVVRAFVGSLNLMTIPPQHLTLRHITEPIGFVSMVPLQIAKLLEDGENLDNVSKLLLGGAPVSLQLAEKINAMVKSEVWETYGMTETITHVAVRRIDSEPQMFNAIDGITFSIDKRECLVVHDPLLRDEAVITNDRVSLYSDTSFRLLGRIDHVINSGGVKVQPEEVERLLESYIQRRYFITSLPDQLLGQLVVLIVEKGEDMGKLKKAIDTIDSYRRPKKIIEMEAIPTLPSGKIDVQAVRKAIS